MRDRRQLPLRVGGVALLDSPITVARKRRGLTLNAAAQRLAISTLRLARLESATRRLPHPAQTALIDRLADPAPCEQLSLFDLGAS